MRSSDWSSDVCSSVLRIAIRITIEHAESHRHLRRLQGRQQAGQGAVGLVVHEDVALGNAALAQGDGFQRDLAALSGSGGQAQAPGAVPAEEHRLAVLQHDLAVGGDAAPGEALEDAVVVHDAVLEDLDQRGAEMHTPATHHFTIGRASWRESGGPYSEIS